MTGPSRSLFDGARAHGDEAERLYERARSLPRAARFAFLERACGGDAELRKELAELLDSAEAAEEFFDRLAGAVASSPFPTLGIGASGEGPASGDGPPVGDGPTSADRATGDLEPPPHGPDPLVGTTVRHYRLAGRIGAGGMGTVYRARDTRLNRDVALKFLPPHLSAELDAEERLLVEARAAAALEHPNVCAVHEIGETDDGRPFIAMAYYEGETLKERLSRGPLPVEGAVTIAIQITRGLAAAHARGIVHRDVKPGNVMLGTDGTVKLLDFGLAKVADVTLTRPGTTPGTMAYMSPEQARGDPVDQRTDLWSLGVVLYEMVTGARPFRGGSDRALLQAILHEDPEPISKRLPEVPEPFTRIVERLLRKASDRRYKGSEEVLADLMRVLPSEAKLSLVAHEKLRRAHLAVRALPIVGRWLGQRSVLQLAAWTGAVLAVVLLILAVRTIGDSEGHMPEAGETGAAPAIAVLPFSVRGQGLEIWREGLVDLLSMGLDGAGGLRAIDSRTVLARWNEEIGDGVVADLEHSLSVARRTRASYALLGSAVAAGPQIRFAAHVYDLGRGQPLGQAQVEGSPDSILALVDRLAAQALVVVLERDPGDLPRIDLASVTTRSLPALRAYLDGEVRYRRSDFEGAIEAWKRAVGADSLFALAYLGLGEAYGWAGGANLDRAVEALGRAYRVADRLPEHEATVLRARWTHWQGTLDGIPLLEEAVRQRPDDAGAWYSLGESYYHLPGAMREPEEARRAFEHAAELQPRSVPYRAHLLDLAFLWNPDSSRIARELEAHHRLAPQGARTQAGRIALALGFGDPAERQRARTALDSLTPTAALRVYADLHHPRFAPEREAVYSAVYARLEDPERWFTAWTHFNDLGLTDGRVREAMRTLQDPRLPTGLRYCAPISLFVGGVPVPKEVLEDAYAMGLADSSSNHDPGWITSRWMTCTATYAARRGRWTAHAALLSYARDMVRRELSVGDSTSARDWDRAVQEVRAHGLWGRGRKAEALERLENLLSSYANAGSIVWYVGQLSFELGRLEDAERAFRRLWEDPAAHLYLGRIYERTGRTAEALEAYEFVLYAWRNADPELRPLIDEAGRAVTRLAAAQG